MAQITVNRAVVQTPPLTGAEINRLAKVPPGHDLWLEVQRGDDLRIDDDEGVIIHGGEAFYTAPKDI